MKKKINDNKTIREKSIKKLLTALLQIEFPPSITLHKTMLREVLLNGKTFGELKETTLLTPFRQKTILENAVNILILDLNELRLRLKLKELDDKILITDQKILEMERVIKLQEGISPDLKQIHSIPIANTGFSIRVKHICLYSEINTIYDLVRLSKREFLALRNCGKKSVQEIEDFYNKNGLSWGMKF